MVRLSFTTQHGKLLSPQPTGVQLSALGPRNTEDCLVDQSDIPLATALLPCMAIGTVGRGTGASPRCAVHDTAGQASTHHCFPTPDNQRLGAIGTHRLLATSAVYWHNDNKSLRNILRSTVLVALVLTGDTQCTTQHKTTYTPGDMESYHNATPTPTPRPCPYPYPCACPYPCT